MRSAERGSSFVVAMCFVMLSVTGIALLSAHVRASAKSLEHLPSVYAGKHVFNTATAVGISLLQTKSDAVPASGSQCSISTAAPYSILQFTTAGGGRWTIQVATQSYWSGCTCARDFSKAMCR